MSPFLRPASPRALAALRILTAFAAPAVGLVAGGCGPARRPPEHPVPLTPPAPPSPSPEPPVGFPRAAEPRSPAAHAARARTEAAGRQLTWLPRDAPTAIREAIRAQPALFESDDRPVLISAAPVDLDADGAPEWLVRVDGLRPGPNARFWAFAERGGRWTILGFLGPAYGALPIGPAPEGGYAPLCRYAFSAIDKEAAAEFVWAGDHYQEVAAYGLDPEGNRPCEQALFADEA